MKPGEIAAHLRVTDWLCVCWFASVWLFNVCAGGRTVAAQHLYVCGPYSSKIKWKEISIIFICISVFFFI